MKKSKPVLGPVCPKCGKAPYDFVMMDPQPKGPAIKRTIWYCPSVDCNPWKEIMQDSEVWPT